MLENTYPLVYYNKTQNLTVLVDNTFYQFMTSHMSSLYLSACQHIYLAELSSIWKTGQVKLKICLLINIEYNWLWNDEAIWLEWIWTLYKNHVFSKEDSSNVTFLSTPILWFDYSSMLEISQYKISGQSLFHCLVSVYSRHQCTVALSIRL